MNGGFRLITYDSTKYKIYSLYSDGSIFENAFESFGVTNAELSGKFLIVLSMTPNTLNIITYDIKNGSRNIILTDHTELNDPIACADSNGSIYLCGRNDSHIYIHNRRGDLRDTVNLPGRIKRLFAGSADVFALTDSGLVNVSQNKITGGEIPPEEIELNGDFAWCGNTVYSLNPDSGLKTIYRSQYPLVCRTSSCIFESDGRTIYRINDEGTPVSQYDTGMNIQRITASAGNLACITADNSLRFIDISQMVPIEQPKVPVYPDKIVSSEVRISDSTIITEGNGTTLAQLKKKLNYGDYNITAYDQNGRTKTSGTVGTGWQLTFTGGGNELSYSIVVRGDLTGEGQVNSSDYKKAADYLTEKTKLTDIELTAADTNNDGRITLSDFYSIYRS